MSSLLPSLAWASAQASGALTVASTGWLVSGLSPSPLVNSLLPALGALPALVPLPFRASTGYGLQIASALLLLLVSLKITGPSVVWPLLAMLLFGFGGQMSGLPLQQSLLRRSWTSMDQLRQGSTLGQLIGNLLTGVLFPIGKAVLQYLNAMVLLLPLLPIVWRTHDPGAAAADQGSSDGAASLRLGFVGRTVAQGALFGSLFGLLALWVRTVGAGNCFDFGMVLTAYGLGRTLEGSRLRPPLGPQLPYLLIAILLAATQLPGLPGWGSVLLFLPMGLLAAGSDRHVVVSLADRGDEPLRWLLLERGGALGGLLGALGIGLLTQVLGLRFALPLEVAAFAAAALVLHRPGHRGAGA
ncbi:hypothetical protein [Cyanobium sp. Morenito 9A2]|uniref:hypothetical protein n=1 Tax=Cyanobium sp. Morenito 9A2 TaxID=2823718 RepID=UPI0020CCD5B5|nr:hypothetical protein [Cyanobium sp. Morenito 9A2]MCP9848214.1 hypothetical protein [Cyanobium sp. Morenito 9A2]